MHKYVLLLDRPFLIFYIVIPQQRIFIYMFDGERGIYVYLSQTTSTRASNVTALLEYIFNTCKIY